MEVDFCKKHSLRQKISRTELIGFFAGIKPAILVGLYDKKDVDETKLIFAKFKLKRKIYFADDSSGGQQWLAISLNPNITKELIQSFLRKDFEKVGRLLGYPPCCAKRYADDLPNRATARDILFRTKGSLSWYVNNVFNPQTRSVFSEKGMDMLKLRKMEGVSIKIMTYPLYLISHFPHSYDCKESIKIAKKTFRAIKKINSAEAEMTKGILKKPILFLDSFHYIVFNGAAKNDKTIIYSSISPPKSLVPTSLLKRIEEGGKISIEGRTIIISKNDKRVHHFEFKDLNPVILNFI